MITLLGSLSWVAQSQLDSPALDHTNFSFSTNDNAPRMVSDKKLLTLDS